MGELFLRGQRGGGGGGSSGTPIDDAVVTLDASLFAYTGTAKHPVVLSVTLGGVTLTEGVDWVSYGCTQQNNIGSYAFTIFGVGNYCGSIVVPWRIANIYGVRWDKSTSTALTRFGTSALYHSPSPATSGGTGSSAFDSHLPWSGVARETIGENEMVKIPKYWFRWTDAEGALSLEISDEALPGFHTSPAHADRSDGKGERDYVYVGRYLCDENYNSKSGVIPVTDVKRAIARAGCRALGDGYSMIDFAMIWTIRMLYLVEFANWDSQTKIGKGCGNHSSKQNTGESDSMNYHTGTMTGRTAYGVGVQYRYIEDLWANVCMLLDGITTDGTAAYVTNVIANYGDTTENYTKVSDGHTDGAGVIKGWDVPTTPGLEWALYPNATGGATSYEIYCTDHNGYATSGFRAGITGGYWNNSGWCGLFYTNVTNPENGRNTNGTRLQYLP